MTEPTDFWGDVFSRFADPFGNLWWVYSHSPATDDVADEWEEESGDASWESFSSPELEYIHSTLVEAMASLKDPRAGSQG